VSGDGLDDGMQGSDAIIHLVGIIMEIRGATFENAHHRSTVNVLAAARRQGVRRVVHMSALGARADGVSGYQTTKWMAEEAVRTSGLEYCILRPSIIFGPRDGFVSQMVQVMKSAPFIRPVVGHGRYPFRPIWIGDVVECFAQALARAGLGKTIDLVGPDELTLDQLLDEIAECVGVRKMKLHVPFPVMYMNAKIMGAILPRPPVTTDQLRMLQEGSTSDPGQMLQTFRLTPTHFREGLRRYLCPPVGLSSEARK
jgi:NADH dehydrogenase